MDASITPQSTVNEVLAADPKTAGVFLRLKTSCVGCHLSRFCTLEDVARFYDLAVEDLLGQLRSARDKNSARLRDTEDMDTSPTERTHHQQKKAHGFRHSASQTGDAELI